MKTKYDEEQIAYARHRSAIFKADQQQPYSLKIAHAKARVREFIKDCGTNGYEYHVSVGGLDSITLLCFIRSLGYNPPAISVSSLEDKSIQAVHKKTRSYQLKAVKDKNRGLARIWLSRSIKRNSVQN